MATDPAALSCGSGLGVGILAGGRSRRMGRDKAWLEFGGEPLLTRLVRELGRLDLPLVVAAGDERRRLPPLPDHVRVVPDRLGLELAQALAQPAAELATSDLPTGSDEPAEGLQGPVAGLLSCFAALPACDRLFVCACDLPLLRAELVPALDALRGDRALCVPRVDGRVQVLCAIYARALLPELARRFLAGERRMRALCEGRGDAIVEEEALRALEPGLRSFRNCNAPGDLDALRGLLEDRP